MPINTQPTRVKQTIRVGSKVTFRNLPEPIMTVYSIDWSIPSAVCKYYDTFSKKNIRLPCDPNDLIPMEQVR